ncbi:MAG: hypothetical protein FD138_3805, partial [Planctomycetota bacterium]
SIAGSEKLEVFAAAADSTVSPEDGRELFVRPSPPDNTSRFLTVTDILEGFHERIQFPAGRPAKSSG